MANGEFEDFQGFWEQVAENKRNNATRNNNIQVNNTNNTNENNGKKVKLPESIATDKDERDIDRLLLMDVIYQMRELSAEVKTLSEQVAVMTAAKQAESERVAEIMSGTSPPNVVQMPNMAQMQMPNAMAAQVVVPQQTVTNTQIGQTAAATPVQEDSSAAKEPKKKKKVASIIGNLMFYVLIIALVFGAFLIRSSQNGKPFMVGGYSAMTVLTGSMQSVYPQGSLIVTKSTDANTLQIGDDITYMTGESSSITHRIIGITENYMDTGKRGFETKGVMNTEPDKEIVAAGNVVGKVVFCSKTLGVIAKFITHNWPLILFVAVVLAGLAAFLKWNSGREDDDGDEGKAEKQKKKKKQKNE